MAEHLEVGEVGEKSLRVGGMGKDSEKIQFGPCQLKLKTLGALRSWQSG